MADLGYFALLLGLFAASYALLIDVLGAWREENALIKSGRNAMAACWICLTAAMIVFWVMLIRCDFSSLYVAKHISRALPLAYRFSALWAGAAGSLLLWLWLQAGFAMIVFGKTSRSQRTFSAKARCSINLVNVFFLLVLILDKNPFTLSVPVPADGAGLNPLLQHPAMVLHPPTLFIGYAALIIPFAWAFAELKEFKEKGLAPLFIQARNWTLIGWLFLTIGIVLGAWWAYEELGWGGYWAWDPVENSSLMPWLTATALLHCYRIYKPRTAIARWLTILSLVTFSLCIFGTFLTRYGLVSSVHAFPEPGLGILFMVLLVHIWVIAAVLLWRKYRRQPVNTQTVGSPGRKFIGLNNWLMVLLTFVILIGTLFPFLSSLFTEQKISLEPEYFTKISAPGGLVLLLMLSICPYLLRQGLDKSWRTIGAGALGIIAVLLWLSTRSLAIPYFVICAFAAVNLVFELFKGKSPGDRRRTLRWYGARIVHTSVVLMFVGIAGSGAYEIEKQAALKPGENIKVGKFDLKYENLSADHGPNFTAVTAKIIVSKNEEVIATLNPSQAYYYSGAKPTSEVDIRRTLLGDIYVALTAVDRNSQLINLRVLIKPLINWIWIGSMGLVLGTVFVLISFYRYKRAYIDM
ncbi:MAG: heme lyase CcmF/NrfE family subunit [Planctomycetota bacterium]|jgi:cytochrome c-type biogenesis protein CcmF